LNKELKRRLIEGFEKEINELKKEKDLLNSKIESQKSVIEKQSKNLKDNYQEFINKTKAEKQKNFFKIRDLQKQNDSLKAKIESQKMIIERKDELN
jgi:type III secretory pathway component EscR